VTVSTTSPSRRTGTTTSHVVGDGAGRLDVGGVDGVVGVREAPADVRDERLPNRLAERQAVQFDDVRRVVGGVAEVVVDVDLHGASLMGSKVTAAQKRAPWSFGANTTTPYDVRMQSARAGW